MTLPPIRNAARLLRALAIPLWFGTAAAQIPAFPGAQGFGASATGGRGGDVYCVTNLNSSGAGSLRYGIENAPATGRTIVFAVSGYIPISYNSDTGNQTVRLVQNKITIAGQTAPGDGIGLKDGRILITGNNSVIRHIRVRHGKYGGAGDCVNLDSSASNTMLDHLSLMFSTDENLSFFNSSLNNFTFQYSITAWGMERHNAGGLWDMQNGTSHHSLWAHHRTRNPKARPNGLLEWINNVTFHWRSEGFIMGDSTSNMNWKSNVQGCYFISIPDWEFGLRTKALTKARIADNGLPNFNLHLNDCLSDTDGDGVLNGTDKGYAIVDGQAYNPAEGAAPGTVRYGQMASPFTGAPVPVSLDDPRTAYKKVLSASGPLLLDAIHSGALRDELDTLLMQSVVNQQSILVQKDAPVAPNDPTPGNGELHLAQAYGITNSGFGTLAGTTAPADTDLDGMPDFWETTLGSNPASQNHNTVFPSATGTFFPAGTPTGYTYLEEYLHFRAVPHAVVSKNTVEQPSSVTADLRKYTSGFSGSPSFTISGVYGGTVAQFAGNGTTPSPTGPIIVFTPTQGFHGRAGFLFQVTDAEGSTWPQQFALLVNKGSTVQPEVRINVDFGAVPYSGTAAASDTGTVWNTISSQAGKSITMTDVMASNGSPTPYDVSVSTTGASISVYNNTTLGNPNPLNLMSDYAFGGTYTVTLSDLPAGNYQLFVYAHGDQANQGSTVTIDASNGGGSAVAGTTGDQYRNIQTTGAEGYSYLKFDPLVGPSGTLVFTVANYINGFQLVTKPKENYFINMTTTAGTTGSTQTIASMSGWNYSGAAPAAGETWNVFNETDFNSTFPNPLNVGQVWTITSNVPLTTANGMDRAARMTVAYHAVTDALTSDRLNTITSVGTVQPGGVMDRLMRNYWDRGGVGNFQRFTLGGLQPNTGYLLYVYGASGGTYRAWIDLDRNGTVDFDTDDDLPTDDLFVNNGDGTFGITPKGHVWNAAVATTDSSGNLSFDSRGHLNGFQVIIYQAPQISQQPDDLTIQPGQQATFSVQASANPEPSFQWFHDGIAIPGATNATLAIPSAAAGDEGDYTVVVSNPGSSVTSDPATLAWVPDPYGSYMTTHGLDPEGSGSPAEDPDHDGLRNILEFFLGMNPNVSGESEKLPTARRDGGMVYEIHRLKQAADVPFTVEYTFDLSNPWITAEDGVNDVTFETSLLDDDYERIIVTIPTTAPRIFARLKL